MAKKGENIFLRKDGRWEARYAKGYELSGRIKYGYCYAHSYKEVKSKVEKAKAAVESAKPLPVRGSRHRLTYFCEEWMGRQKPRVKESSYAKYDYALKCHIIPKLGSCFPQGMTTQLVDAFRQELTNEGLTCQSIRNTLIVLRAILKYGSEQYPEVFPQLEVHYPKEPRREPRVLSHEEQRRFVDYLQKDMDPCKFGMLLALMTGLRIGEICALKWENISLENCTLRVTATMQRVKDITGTGPGKTKILIGNPKSDTSMRSIPLTEDVCALCRRNDPHRLSAYVLTGADYFMEPRKLQRRFEKFTAECGLRDVHFHTLRHTFATRCMEVGFELKSLSEIMGHAKASTTLDRYIHSSMEIKRVNMAKVVFTGSPN